MMFFNLTFNKTLAALASFTLCLLTSPAKADLTLADFRGTGFTGTYDSWIGNTFVNPAFVEVNATIYGGGYLGITPVNLTTFLTNNLQLYVRQGTGALTNDGTKNILLQLKDNNGFKAGYVWSMAGLPTSTQPFTILSRQLNNPNYYTGGATSSSFNFGSIKEVELLGDFSGSNSLNLEFQSVTVVPEPSTIVGGALLTLFAVCQMARRRKSGVLLGLTASLICAASLSSSYAETATPVVTADFEDSPEISIAGKNNASVENRRENWVEGKFGKAAAFTKSDEKPGAELVYDIKGAFDDHFTIMLWAKLNEPGNAIKSGSGPERFLFRLMRSGAWGDGDVIAGFNNWGKIVFYQYENSSRFNVTSALDGGGVNDDQWHHFAFVYDAGARHIFVDGVELKYDTDASPVDNLADFQKIRLGALTDPASSPDGEGTGLLDGEIDQFRIYSTALSAKEIGQLASSKN